MSLFRRKKKEKRKEEESESISTTSQEEIDEIISKAVEIALLDETESREETQEQALKKPVPSLPSMTSLQSVSRSIPHESSSLVSSRASVSAKSASSVSRVVQLPGGVRVRPEVQQILPTWIEKKYYWARPDPRKHPDLHQSWLEEWGSFLLKWAEATRTHVVSIPHLISEFPFNNPIIKAKLLEPEIREICEHLIYKNLAKWYDKTKRRLRIYWKTLEEFAEDLYDWAFLRGESFATLMDLVQAGQPWSNLPPKELQQLMEFLVKERRAEWADEEKRTIQFIYE